MTPKALGQAVVIVLATGLFIYVIGYAAPLPQLRMLSTQQQAWAVLALGLIAAILLLFRASQASEVTGQMAIPRRPRRPLP
jgi:predicted aspartyl protease